MDTMLDKLDKGLAELDKRKNDSSYWQQLHEWSIKRRKEELEKWEKDQMRMEKKYKEQEQGVRWLYPVWKLECHNCGRIFYTERTDYYRIKFCKRECQQEKANKTAKEARRERNRKLCRQCGQIFQAKKADTVYCSHACKQKAYRGRQLLRQRNNQNP